MSCKAQLSFPHHVFSSCSRPSLLDLFTSRPLQCRHGCRKPASALSPARSTKRTISASHLHEGWTPHLPTSLHILHMSSYKTMLTSMAARSSTASRCASAACRRRVEEAPERLGPAAPLPPPTFPLPPPLLLPFAEAVSSTTGTPPTMRWLYL